EELAVCRPDLIMVSTSLRGQTGGERLYTGFGGQGAALSGFTLLTGWPDLPPDGPWGAYTDFVAPRFALTALAAAVRHRDLTGQGQLIDIAQTEAPICFLEPEALDAAFNGVVAGRLGDRSSRFAPQGVFAVSGVERYVAIGVETDEQWCSLAELVGIDSGSDRRAEHDLIDEAIEAWTSTREATEAVDLLIAAGVPAALVARSSDLHNDPQLEHRCFFAHLDHPTLGVTPFDGQATVFSATPAVLRHAGPLPGADNEFVLRELLGYDQSRIAQLAAAGILS
ncbi:MAG: CoA transferase, partial [Acidimicrobiales bacterium]